MRYTFSTNYTFLTKTQAVRFKYSADLSCPLCPHMDNALHMLSGCQHSTIRNMITERHKMVNRKTITALTKSVHGANLFILTLKVLLNLLINAWAPRLLLQMLPPCLLPGLSDQAIETSSRPDAILILCKGSPHEYITLQQLEKGQVTPRKWDVHLIVVE